MKFRLIEDQRETFPVRAMCDVLGVSPAGYYVWRSRPESHRKAVNHALLAEMRRVHAADRGDTARPGFTRPCAPRGMWRAAAASNVSCVITASGPESAGFGCAPWTAITTCRPHRICSNRPSWRRGLSRFGWPTSPTCQPPKGGSIWPSLLDLFTRKIVGWSMRDHLRADLAIAALSMAIQRQRPAPGPIHHFDRGSQYFAADYRKALTESGSSSP
jgi:putative transposase